LNVSLPAFKENRQFLLATDKLLLDDSTFSWKFKFIQIEISCWNFRICLVCGILLTVWLLAKFADGVYEMSSLACETVNVHADGVELMCATRENS
jgi:hypothetical protein